MRWIRHLRAGAAVAAMGAAALLIPATAHASVTVTSHFVVDGAANTSSGDTMYINNAATNGQPNALLFVTQNYDPNGVCGCVYQAAPIGVWYDGSEWGVFTEDGSTMPTGASFNVLSVPRASNTVFVHRSNSGNDSGSFTVLNNPQTNNKPSVQLEVTQNWNPGGTGGAANDHTVGVRYNRSFKKWTIFNEDGTSMADNLSFNVMVGAGPSNGAKGIVQKSTAANNLGDGTGINDSKVNGDPNAVVFVTPDFDPSGRGGTFSRNVPGVYYDGENMVVFNESGTTMHHNVAYNVLLFAS